MQANEQPFQSGPAKPFIICRIGIQEGFLNGLDGLFHLLLAQAVNNLPS
jgi:hypothetical protein